MGDASNGAALVCILSARVRKVISKMELEIMQGHLADMLPWPITCNILLCQEGTVDEIIPTLPRAHCSDGCPH